MHRSNRISKCSQWNNWKLSTAISQYSLNGSHLGYETLCGKWRNEKIHFFVVFCCNKFNVFKNEGNTTTILVPFSHSQHHHLVCKESQKNKSKWLFHLPHLTTLLITSFKLSMRDYSKGLSLSSVQYNSSYHSCSYSTSPISPKTGTTSISNKRGGAGNYES